MHELGVPPSIRATGLFQPKKLRSELSLACFLNIDPISVLLKEGHIEVLCKSLGPAPGVSLRWQWHVKADYNVALSEAHGQPGDFNISLF